MTGDPAGLYARLGVPPTATPAVIIAAFRRKARVLHPDIPGTGNAAAFVQVKEAYDVLADAHRRAAYDRAARAMQQPVHVRPTVSEPVTRGPRFSDLPLGVWFGLGGVFLVAAVMAVLGLSRPAPSRPPVARPFAPTVPAASPTASAMLTVPADGAVTHFVLPGGGEAVVWRREPARDEFLPIGRLADFTAVRAISVVPQHGLVEIRLAAGGAGFIDAARLASGSRIDARRAYCAYNAGPLPHSGEVLARRADGNASLTIRNSGGEPAVVKLRDTSGHAVVSVFLAPAASTVLSLPDGTYRPDFASGELWSRACNSFAAGMRAQRFNASAPLAGLSPLVVPPELSAAAAAVDIPSDVFEQD